MKRKNDIRQTMKQRLKAINFQERYINEQHIRERVLAHPDWKAADTIALTISGAIEIDTRQMIEQAWKEKKRVVVPKCLPETKRLDFREIETFDQLETVYFGLLEPKMSETELVEKHGIDLVIVPGLAFDTRGYRIGFGAGYYDRFLVDYKGKKGALAFDEQLSSELPLETHDIPVDWIVTPTKVIEC